MSLTSTLCDVTYQAPEDPWKGTARPPTPPAQQYQHGYPAPQGPWTPSYQTAAFPQTPAAKHSWWTQAPTLGKVALISVTALLLCGGGLTALGAITGSPDPTPTNAAVAVADSPMSSAPPATAEAPSTAAAASPTVEKRTVTETQSIPYPTRRVDDPSLAKGSTRIRVRGVAGVKTLTYEVTLANGVQTSKKLVRTQTTKRPVTQVVAVGTKHVQECDPNYSGACVPIASDVDCAGGGGDGPAYVQGPVKVIGTDIYGLDRDGDGIGCE